MNMSSADFSEVAMTRSRGFRAEEDAPVPVPGGGTKKLDRLAGWLSNLSNMFGAL